MIDLTQVPTEGLNITGVIETINISDDSKLNNVVWQFAIIPSYTSDFFVDVKGAAIIDDLCVRCLKPVKKDLTISSQFLISNNPTLKVGGAYTLNRQDLDTVFLAESFLNEEDIVREQFQLNIPNHILCHDDCKGLCVQCGVNLNSNTCSCSSVVNDKPSSTLFKALSGLKLNLSNDTNGSVG